MLELKDIVKIYPAAGENVEALRGVSLRFRESEFVSILGPSGCGKTTLLNILGGLDQYTSGDLMINGRSTKDFHDRDWDAYRNHSVGFVFQTYNLIPHQTILRNVELALTLAGVPKQERRKRAVEALEKVGLKDQISKKPGELSGGQMQRVAIARAIVNDPDIVLADEPTGALDTGTSVQVLDILREIAKDRLVVMVTHNPDLADRYSTRIIRMLDGKITDDTGPLTEEEIRREAEGDLRKTERAKQTRLPSMSLRTSFGLSLKNLIAKKGRTILTSFAGSIGIIGIALIYAVSHGMTAYIDSVQEETLSSYPLTLEAQHIDSSSLISTFMGTAQSVQEHGEDGVYQKGMIYEMMNALGAREEKENDLRSFKAYLDRETADGNSVLGNAVSAVQYTYDTQLTVYTRNAEGEIIASDLQQMMQEILSEVFQTDMSGLMALRNQAMTATQTARINSNMNLWREMLPGRNGELLSPLFGQQYDLVYGSWPSKYDEVILIMDEDGELTDLALYAMGLLPKENVEKIIRSAFTREQLSFEAKHWSFEEICALDYRVILPVDCYVLDEETGKYRDLRETDIGLQYLFDNALKLKVTGIIRPSPDAVATMISSGIGYTAALTEYLMGRSAGSPVIRAQMENPSIDVMTGLPFNTPGEKTENEKAETFREWTASMDVSGRAGVYRKLAAHPSEEKIRAEVEAEVSGIPREELVGQILAYMTEQAGMNGNMYRGLVEKTSDEELRRYVVNGLMEQRTAEYAETAAAKLEGLADEELAARLEAETAGWSEAEFARAYDLAAEFSDATLEKNLKALGHVDPDSPAMISLYAATFANKDAVEKAIREYNDSVEEMSRISYTDYVGLIMSSVTTIISAITWVLIAFVAISLIVSSIMIGVITLISVQERTKEIGILRAIGASRRNVSGMFNAETVMIGLASGLIGVGFTWLVCIPINLILHHLTGLNSLNASLPVLSAAVLVLISVLLTLLAGIIPSRSAAKKDPVVALRTE